MKVETIESSLDLNLEAFSLGLFLPFNSTNIRGSSRDVWEGPLKRGFHRNCPHVGCGATPPATEKNKLAKTQKLQYLRVCSEKF